MMIYLKYAIEIRCNSGHVQLMALQQLEPVASWRNDTTLHA